MSATGTQFAGRRRIMTVRKDAFEIATAIQQRLVAGKEADLRSLLDAQHPADLADAMHFLSDEEDRRVFEMLDAAEAAVVLDEVDATTEARLLDCSDPERLAAILSNLPSDEGTDVVGMLVGSKADQVLGLLERSHPHAAQEIRTLLTYPKDTAGGVMSLGYVAVVETATQAEALAEFKDHPEAEQVFYVYVVDAQGGLLGSVELRKLLLAAPTVLMRELMDSHVLSIPPETDQEQVAAIFARYDLTALPVTGPAPECLLLGVITADDIIDVLEEESSEDIAHLAGSDAQELEKRSPAQVAKLRLPWILTTMMVELLAGCVIHYFDATLTKYILLASFMPIISAISGNTGLQSAAIIIRGLSTGQVQLSGWKHAVARQVATTMILGGVCAAVLGIIGAVWDKHWVFGMVVFLGMFLAVNIAGIVGTVVPLISKRAGFDPALTAGPFETAFQDVVGISIFLSLATLLLNWLR